MKYYPGKTTPKVSSGHVRKKNNWKQTANYYNTPQQYPVLDKEKPGPGYKHLIKKRELFRFIDLVPMWDDLAEGLNGLVLAAGEPFMMGWHTFGVVGICAWDIDIEWQDAAPEFYDEHKIIFKKLGIKCNPIGENWHIHFTEESAKAFQLIHVFIHELGHHHDRITSRKKEHSGRGEQYAEEYAAKYEDLLIEKYMNEFGLY